MKSRMSSWASFFTLGGMSPSTCRVGEAAQGLVFLSSSLWLPVWPRVLCPRWHHPTLPCVWGSSWENGVLGTTAQGRHENEMNSHI